MMGEEHVVRAEDVFSQRVAEELEAASPGFDLSIIDTLFEVFNELVELCSNTTKQATPEQVVAGVKNMSNFQKSRMVSRLKRRAKENGVRDAGIISGLAVSAVTKVAKSATKEEQLAFAARALNLSSSETFDLI